jgi:hypothetical protein
MSDVQVKGKIIVDTGSSGQQIDSVKRKLNEAGAAGKGAGGTFSNLKQSLGGMAEGMTSGGKSAGLLNQAFNVLRANPVTGVFILIAGLVIALVNQFRKMEGVSDSLGKAWASLSGMMETFTTAILSPLVDGFIALVEWGTKAAQYLVSIVAPGIAKAGEESAKLAEELDNLEDAEEANQVARARSMRQMAEAREIAADANVPIKERIAALQEAARIERQALQESIENNLRHARIIIAQSALRIGATQQEIDMIKAANAAQLERVRLQLAARKDINKEELNASIEFIMNAEEAGKDLANVERKTQKQITSIMNEAAMKQKQAADAARQKRMSDEKEFSSFLEKENERRLLMHMSAFDKELYELNKKYKRAYELAKQYGWDQKQLDALRIQDALEVLNKQTIADKAKYDLFEANIKAHLPKMAALNTQLVANDQQAAEVQKYTAAELVEFKRNLYGELGNTMNAFADLIGRETVAGKALAVASATVNTYLAATKSLAADYSAFGPFALAAKIAATAATIATGLTAVRNIVKTPIPGRGMGGVTAPSMSSGLAVSPLSPAPQAVQVELNRNSINRIGNAADRVVNRSYVLDSDINNSAERNARIMRAARLG